MTTKTNPTITKTVASDVLDGDRVHLGDAWRTVRYTVADWSDRTVALITADGGTYVLGFDAPVSVFDL